MNCNIDYQDVLIAALVGALFGWRVSMTIGILGTLAWCVCIMWGNRK